MSRILDETIRNIKALDEGAMARARMRLDGMAKPLHSLGRLEDALVQIAGITGNERIRLDRKTLLIFCADNGVVEEGVSQSGQEVTAVVAENFLAKKTVSALWCAKTGTRIVPVDVGMAADTSLPDHKVARGTRNMTKGPAMSRGKAVQAVETGIRLAEEEIRKGCDLLAAGEMGIGNTTTSSAVASVLLGCPPGELTGRGAGLSREGYERKLRAIGQAIAINRPDPSDPLDVLAKVGGFDIAAMAGAYLAAAAHRVPAVLDGLISCVAALAAVRMNSAAAGYLIPSHASREPAAERLLAALGKKALLDCELCLGEGSGAVLLFPLLDLACTAYREMATFDEIGIEAYQPLV